MKKITKNPAKLKVEDLSLPCIYLSVNAHFIFENEKEGLVAPPPKPQKREEKQNCFFDPHILS